MPRKWLFVVLYFSVLFGVRNLKYISDEVSHSIFKAAQDVLKLHETSDESDGQLGVDATEPLTLTDPGHDGQRSKRSLRDSFTDSRQMREFMHGFVPFTGTGNREDLTITGVVEEAIRVNPKTPAVSFKYIRFNSSDYVMLHEKHSVHVWKKSFSGEKQTFEFDTRNAWCSLTADNLGEILMTVFFTQIDGYEETLLFATVAKEVNGLKLRTYDVSIKKCRHSTVTDLSNGRPMKLSFVQSQNHGSLLVLFNGFSETPIIRCINCGHDFETKVVEISVKHAIDLDTFVINGNAFAAVGYGKGCDVFEFDVTFQVHPNVRSFILHDLTSLKAFRLGFDQFLGISTRGGFQYLYTWKDNSFIRSQVFELDRVTQWDVAQLTTCRDDVIVFMYGEGPHVPVTVFLWNGMTRTFNLAIDDIRKLIPHPFDAKPFAQTSFTYNHVVYVLQLDTNGLPHLVSLHTKMESVADPLFVSQNYITRILKEIRDRFVSQHLFVNKIKEVFKFAVRASKTIKISSPLVFRSIKAFNSIRLRQLENLKSVRWDRSPLRLDDLRIKVEDLRNSVTELKSALQSVRKSLNDVVLRNRPSIVKGGLTFEGRVVSRSVNATSMNIDKVNDVVVTNVLNNVYQSGVTQSVISGKKQMMKAIGIRGEMETGLVNGIRLKMDAVTTNRASKMIVPIKLGMLTVKKNLIIDGLMNGLNVSSDLIYLNGSKYVIPSTVHLMHPFTRIQSLKTNILDGIHVDLFRNSVLMSDGHQHITGPISILAPILTKNVELHGSFNGLNFSHLMLDLVRVDKPTVITGRKEVLNNLVIRNNLEVKGMMNGLRIPENLVSTLVPQQITAPKMFRREIVFDKPILIHGLVDGIKLPEGVIRLTDKTPIEPLLIFGQGITVEKNVDAKGLVDGVDVSHIDALAMKKDMKTFKGLTVFKGPVVLRGNLHVNGDVNGVNLMRIYNDAIFKDSKEPVFIHAPKKFFGKVMTPNLQLRTINRYRLGNFVSTFRDGKIDGRVTFDAPVTFTKITVNNGFIGKVNVPRLLHSRLSLKDSSILVEGNHFRRIQANSLNARGTVNGVHLKDLVLKSVPQTIIAPKIINGNVIFEGGLISNRVIVEGLVDGINLHNIIKHRITLKGNQKVPLRFNVARSAFRRIKLRSGKTCNGVDLTEFVRNILYKTGDQVVVAPKTFKKLIINNATSTRGINGVSLRVLDRNAIKLHGNQVIRTQGFRDPLTVNGNVFVEGLINGVNFNYFSVDALRKVGSSVVTGLNTFEHGFHVKGDIHTNIVNALNLPSNVISKTRDQTITGKLKFNNLEIGGNIILDNEVNGIDLSLFNQQIMKVNRPNYVLGNLKFTKPTSVLSNLYLAGELNQLNVTEIAHNTLMRVGKQLIPGRINIAGPARFFSNINAESINGVNIRKFLSDVVFVFGKHPQVINAHKTFVSGFEAQNHVDQLHGTTSVGGLINGVNLNTLVHSCLRIDRPALIDGKLLFANNVAVKSPKGVRIDGLLNGVNMNRDPFLLHRNPAGHRVQAIRGNLIFEALTVRDNIRVKGLVNGYDLRFIAFDTLLKYGNQNVTGAKSSKLAVLEKGGWIRRINGINDLRDIVKLNENRIINGHWVVSNNVLTINGNLHVKGLLGPVNLRRLQHESLMNNVPQLISAPITFETVVFKQEVRLDGPINGLYLRNFSHDFRSLKKRLIDEERSIDEQLRINLNRSNVMLQLLENSIHSVENFLLFQELPHVRGSRMELHGKHLFGITELNYDRSIATVHLVRYNEHMNIFEKRGVERNLRYAERKMFFFDGLEYVIHQSSPNNDSKTVLRQGSRVVGTIGKFVDDLQLLHNPRRKEVMMTSLISVLGKAEIYLLKKVANDVIFRKIGILIVGPGANKVVAFNIEGDYFVAVARSFGHTCPSMDTGSLLFIWESRKSFKLVQRFPLWNAIDVVYYCFNNQHYLAFSESAPIDETMKPQAVHVYRNKPDSVDCPFVLFQQLPFDNLIDLTAFSFGVENRPEMFIAAVNISVLQIWRQNGHSGFVESWSMRTFDGQFVEPILVDKRLFLVVGQNKECVGSFIFEAVIKGFSLLPLVLKSSFNYLIN